MGISISIEEIILDDSPVYVAYPDDEIFSEIVGIGESPNEACINLAHTFNQMLYSENGIPILIEV
jgi:hypothetical protein